MQSNDRHRKLTHAQGTAAVRSLHLRGLSEAGAARAAALSDADRQLDRIARLLHDALQAGVPMAEIARVTGVSRQTLYELRGRYGDTADLRFAVLQAVLTQYPSQLENIAESLSRPAQEVEALIKELMDQGFIEWDLDAYDGDGAPYYMTGAGLQALEQWTLADEHQTNNPRREQ